MVAPSEGSGLTKNKSLYLSLIVQGQGGASDLQALSIYHDCTIILTLYFSFIGKYYTPAPELSLGSLFVIHISLHEINVFISPDCLSKNLSSPSP